MKKVKVFAMYLPQYHETPENSLFWGPGFTDWVGVKKAEPLFAGHQQPRVPLADNYYDLSQKGAIAWQVELARRYHIDGWGIYHYWFSSEKCVLTKPAEILLENKDLQLPFFFAWDNISWKRTWSKIKGNDWMPLEDQKRQRQDKTEPEVLIEYVLGEREDWEKHFNYLLPYFMDPRYVRHGDKPVFMIYNYSKELDPMAECWNELALKTLGTELEIIYRYSPLHGIPKESKRFTYEPAYSSGWEWYYRAKRFLLGNSPQKKELRFSYDTVWKKILWHARTCLNKKTYYGAFVGFDDTARRGRKARIILGGSPQKFEKYLRRLICISAWQDKEFIFLTAWNEWGEGAYLEPDTRQGYGYLEALQAALSAEDAAEGNGGNADRQR